MVHATVHNLTKAFEQHVQYVTSCHAGGRPVITPSARLLLFYAVECGLKALLLLRAKRPNTKGFESNFAHDLNTGLGRVDCPVRLPKSIRAKASGQELPIGEWHEAWRYGIKLVNAEETEVTAKFREVITWLKEKLDEETVV